MRQLAGRLVAEMAYGHFKELIIVLNRTEFQQRRAVLDCIYSITKRLTKALILITKKN